MLRRESSPEAVTGRLAFLCGLTETDAPVTPRELLDGFSWDKIKTADIPLL